MAKSTQKIKARKLRSDGKSIKEISKVLGVSKSSVSIWCRNIELSALQVDNLHKKMIAGGYKGRLAGAKFQKEKRLARIDYFEGLGTEELKNITPKELLLAGIGLYLGEGNKKGNGFQFTNSNPDIIKLVMKWSENLLGVDRKDFYCNILINISHKHRENSVKKTWSNILKIPKDQFRKTVFIKSAHKKTFENPDLYLGTLILRVKKSSDLQYRILGLMKGLLYSVNR
ncbi:MAG: hypothetical protein HY093_03915 [Candidatus Liptonbacteria bacterium]|nr:hypothetical protein [Candidatus Liptonbacteria bacterium]